MSTYNFTQAPHQSVEIAVTNKEHGDMIVTIKQDALSNGAHGLFYNVHSDTGDQLFSDIEMTEAGIALDSSSESLSSSVLSDDDPLSLVSTSDTLVKYQLDKGSVTLEIGQASLTIEHSADSLILNGAAIAFERDASLHDVIHYMPTLKKIMNPQQLNLAASLTKGSESQFYKNKLVELARLFENMPKTYEQDGKGSSAIAYLHYFRGGTDAYIIEKDSEEEQIQAMAYVDLGYGFEAGYVSIQEYLDCGLELDFHFKPQEIKEVLSEKSDLSNTP